MRKSILTYGALAFILALSGCSQQPPADTRAADEAAIRDLDAKWSKAASANDLDATVSYYSADASLLPPNAPLAVGAQAIRASWASLLVPGVNVSWQVSKVDVARSGELAYVIGTYQVIAKDAKGNPATEHGKLLEVWKKQEDGQWKTVADIYNSDAPAPTP